MEKRRRGMSLTGLFWRYLFCTGAGIGLLSVIWVLLLSHLGNIGFILRADRGEQEAEEAAERIEAGGGMSELEKLSYCRYAVFDAQGDMTATNMNRRYLELAKNAMAGGSGNLGLIQYHRQVRLADGSLCLLQYDFSVPYADPVLQKHLPDFQTTYLLLWGLLAFLYAFCVTRHFARVLKKDAAALAAAGQSIAQGRLDPDPGQADRARVRELDAAMQAIHTLRDSLKQSLEEQWRTRQERTAQIAALAHDLKTPLSVVSGNAELLEEEELTEGQREPVAAIRRGVERAQAYVEKLQQTSIDGLRAGDPEEVELADFWKEIADVGRGLCAQKKIIFEVKEAPAVLFPAYREELERALGNLLENAVRFTPAGGRICLSVNKEKEYLVFQVQDGGPGFSNEALVRAGNAFYRAADSRPADGHLGLGLHFARQIAEKHGGTLRIENTGQGARVSLSAALRW